MPRKKATPLADGEYEYPLSPEMATLEAHYRENPICKIILGDKEFKIRLKIFRNGAATTAVVTSISSYFGKELGGWMRVRDARDVFVGVSYCNPTDEPSTFIGDRIAVKRAIAAVQRFMDDDMASWQAKQYYDQFRVKQRQVAGWRGVESRNAQTKPTRHVIKSAHVKEDQVEEAVLE